MDDLSCFRPSNLLYTQERMQRYRTGGFHPVSLGDTFCEGRYRVYHKLGWGGFSTVWLARDKVLKQWVSLKIPLANGPGLSQELPILHKLRTARAAHRIAKLLDSFVHHEPNGSHQCLVFELLGPTLDFVVIDYHEDGERLEAETILRITRRLLQGLAAIHEAGYAHGDISGSNIAFTARNLARSSTKSMMNILGTPKFEKSVRLDGEPLLPGMPEQLVAKANWDTWVDEDEEDVRIIDFGEAFAHGAEPANLAEPGDLQAPENIFTGRFDYRVDLWRAGCTICTMVFGSRPFWFLGNNINSLVAQMISFIEELPVEWKPEWERLRRSDERK